jgi:hypothetical protein
MSGAFWRLSKDQVMSQIDEPPPDRLLLAPEAAKVLRLSPATLAKHRCYGTGPVYRKNGGRILYALSDLHDWSRRGVRRSTSDRDAVTTLPAQAHAAVAPAYTGRCGDD